jgi:hypothetical protein
VTEQQPEAPAAPSSPVAADLEAALAKSREGARTLGKIVVGQTRAMQAARIELAQGSAEKAMQWILNSLPDVWDDPEAEWDGRESAAEWWDRTDSFYREAEKPRTPSGGAEPSVDTPRALPTLPDSARDDPGASPPECREALGRLVRDTWCAWASEQDDPKPSWLLSWEEIDDGQREADMRIGEAVAGQAGAKLASIAALCRGHLEQAERGGACCPHLAGDILAITGSEGAAE